MLNQQVNDCVRACNRCAAICIRRACASFAASDPSAPARRHLLDQEQDEAWMLCAQAFRALQRRR